MKFTIDEAVVTRLGMDLPSLFATLLVKTGADIEQVFSDLVKKEVLVKGMLGGYSVTLHRQPKVLTNSTNELHNVFSDVVNL